MTTVLVATSGGLHVLRGADAPHTHFDGRGVTQVVAAGSRWLALVGGEVWTCEDGETWAQLGSVDAPEATCLHPAGGAVWVGAEPADLYELGAGRVPGFAEIEGRDGWYTPWGGPPAVRSMDDAGGALFVNVHVGGIPRSTDGGATWEPTIDVDSDVHQVRCANGRVYAATAFGLAGSTDAGRTWDFTTDGLDTGAYCRAVAVTDGHLLVSASSGPSGREAMLYRRPMDGGTFAACLSEPVTGNIDTHWVSAFGVTAACGLPEGRVVLSEDAGATWAGIASGLPAISAVLCLA